MPKVLMVMTDLLGLTSLKQFQHSNSRCCCYWRRYCLLGQLRIIAKDFQLRVGFALDGPDLLQGWHRWH